MEISKKLEDALASVKNRDDRDLTILDLEDLDITDIIRISCMASKAEAHGSTLFGAVDSQGKFLVIVAARSEDAACALVRA